MVEAARGGHVRFRGFLRYPLSRAPVKRKTVSHRALPRTRNLAEASGQALVLSGRKMGVLPARIPWAAFLSHGVAA